MRTIIFLTLALFLQGAIGELVCEDLPVGMCSFSISSSGNRCSLETFESADGTVELQCKTSQVMSINMHEYIENDECVNSCGVDRNSVGISSDALLETQFTTQLCSPPCLQNCLNIVDLYYNLALAEGVLLDELCKFQQTSSRRSVIQLQSSSAAAAAGPISAAGPMSAAAIAPTPFSSGSSSVNCAPAPQMTTKSLCFNCFSSLLPLHFLTGFLRFITCIVQFRLNLNSCENGFWMGRDMALL